MSSAMTANGGAAWAGEEDAVPVPRARNVLVGTLMNILRRKPFRETSTDGENDCSIEISRISLSSPSELFAFVAYASSVAKVLLVGGRHDILHVNAAHMQM